MDFFSETSVLPSMSDHRVNQEAERLLATLHDLPDDEEKAQDLRDRIAHLHYRIVIREAGRYRNRGVEAEELRQVAAVGLMKAINGFDPYRGKRFLSYLLPTVTGELKRHFRDNLWAVHVARVHRDRRSELNRFVTEFTQDHARPPNQTEVGEHFGLGPRETGELINAASSYSALSLDSPQGADSEGEDGLLGNSVGAPDRELESVVDRTALRNALTLLPEVQRRVLLLSFFEEWPQTRIAAQLGCSQMQVSRLIRAGLAELRAELVPDD